MRTWSGARVSVLVCTRGAAFGMDWWKFGGVSYDGPNGSLFHFSDNSQF